MVNSKGWFNDSYTDQKLADQKYPYGYVSICKWQIYDRYSIGCIYLGMGCMCTE